MSGEQKMNARGSAPGAGHGWLASSWASGTGARKARSVRLYLDDFMMMMMIFHYCNQRLLFEFLFTFGRVLSIHTDPCQALVKKFTKTKKENYRKRK